MKLFAKIILLLLLPIVTEAQSQQNQLDSLHHALLRAKGDSAKFQNLSGLSDYYFEANRDSALYYLEQQILLAEKFNSRLPEARVLSLKAYQLAHLGRYGEALADFLAAFKIAEDPESEKFVGSLPTNLTPRKVRLDELAIAHLNFGHLLKYTDNTEQCLHEYFETKKLAEETDNKPVLSLVNMNLGSIYTQLWKLDSALIFEETAEKYSKESGKLKYLGTVYYRIGFIYFLKGNLSTAKQYFHKAINTGKEQVNLVSITQAYFSLSKTFLQEKNKDSSLWYAQKTMEGISNLGASIGSEINFGTAYENIYQAYELRNELDSAYKYQKLALISNNSLYKKRLKSLAEFQKINLNEKIRLQELEKEKVVYSGRIRTYSLLAGLVVFLLIALILYRNNQQKLKANNLLYRQKEEINNQHNKAEQALAELKATQTQLIQSEKMASLGELTAGIAHEIQNPLNFVNNFSEVNKELIAEMREEITKGNYDDVNALAKDIEDNEEKINHHGKRADAIVKGMLQHSRSSSGVKEPTNINTLADEYLRLAYHGLRAKDKSFNATMKTEFDETIGNINIIPQDIGRVILNLISNAFYACAERSRSTVDEKKNSSTLRQAQNNTGPARQPYEPTVTVSTIKINGKVEIRVADNGDGIPHKILDKIFQPFFTTKPTGQGTGLGLSLAYDIVKAHGGELKVDTKEGEGSELIIQLPIA